MTKEIVPAEIKVEEGVDLSYEIEDSMLLNMVL